MQRHAESGPPAGPLAGRTGLRIARENLENDHDKQQQQQNNTDAAANGGVARTPTAAASTPRGAADDTSDAGTDRDGATQLRKRGEVEFERAVEPRGGRERREREGEESQGQRERAARLNF